MPIRNAQEKDFMNCVRIARSAWPNFKERESIYHLFCKFFSTTSLVSESDGHIRAFLLGFLSQVDPRDAYIHLVAVDPLAQRQGVATELYTVFFKTVMRLGAGQVRLIVNPDNPGSLHFHKKLGFEEDLHGDVISDGGVLAVKDYNGPGLHMVPFCRSLP